MAYSANKCTGGTPSASSEYSTYYASRAFNGNKAEDGWVGSSSSGQPCWIQYQFASAVRIKKLSVWAGSTAWNNIPNPLYLVASNTGAFAGEEVTLVNSGSISWARYEQKDWEFSNTSDYLYYRVRGNAGGDYPRVGEIEMYEVEAAEGDITDGISVADTFVAESSTEIISSATSISDTMECFSLSDTITDGVGVSDINARILERELPTTDASTYDDAISALMDAYGSNIDAVSIDDAMEAFNWSKWLEQYDGDIITRYYFTLTGTSDGVADVVIPISSFSYRRRDGEASYLSVVIPTLDYSSYITARPNGEMKLEVSYLFVGVEVLRETIIVVDLDSVRTDEGARSQSTTLTGHSDESSGGQICTPRGINYKSNTDGTWTIRCQPDPYLRPGDTVRVDGIDLFVADYVSSYVSGNQASMEVSGA